MGRSAAFGCGLACGAALGVSIGAGVKLALIVLVASLAFAGFMAVRRRLSRKIA